MATVGKSFNATAALSGGTNATSGTLYSCPAGSFGIIQLSVSSATSGAHPRFKLGTRIIWQGGLVSAGTWINGTFTAAGVTTVLTGIYIGPGEVLSFDTNTPGHSVFITGVQYSNT